jgi:hypothetical protein
MNINKSRGYCTKNYDRNERSVQNIETKAMKYGKLTEDTALRKVEKAMNVKILKNVVCLFI